MLHVHPPTVLFQTVTLDLQIHGGIFFNSQDLVEVSVLPHLYLRHAEYGS